MTCTTYLTTIFECFQKNVKMHFQTMLFSQLLIQRQDQTVEIQHQKSLEWLIWENFQRIPKKRRDMRKERRLGRRGAIKIGYDSSKRNELDKRLLNTIRQKYIIQSLIGWGNIYSIKWRFTKICSQFLYEIVYYKAIQSWNQKECLQLHTRLNVSA